MDNVFSFNRGYIYIALYPRDFILFIPKSFIVFSSVQFICSVGAYSLRPHRLQHARLPCPSPTPGVYSNPCPLS